MAKRLNAKLHGDLMYVKSRNETLTHFADSVNMRLTAIRNAGFVRHLLYVFGKGPISRDVRPVSIHATMAAPLLSRNP